MRSVSSHRGAIWLLGAALAVAGVFGLTVDGASVLANSPRSEGRAPASAPKPKPDPRRLSGDDVVTEAAEGAQAAGFDLRLGHAERRVETPTDKSAQDIAVPLARKIPPVSAARIASRALDDALSADGGLPLSMRSGDAGYILVDLGARQVLERRNADDLYIPASVAKAPTALYALDGLGGDYRFPTMLYADGEIIDGELRGDLYLVGTGDPSLDTGDLADLAKALVEAGVTKVAGAFYYDSSMLPSIAQIEPTQPVNAAYNPSVSALNLNYNRVLMQWERQKSGDYDIGMHAHAERYSIPAATHLIDVLPDDSSGPIFRYTRDRRRAAPGAALREVEHWGVKRRVLGRRGQRWVPVQRPEAYAANAFRSVATELGVELPEPRVSVTPGGVRVLAEHESAPLKEILRVMLRYSTNLTAEAVGLAASRARGLRRLDFKSSGALMTGWLNARYGLDGMLGGSHIDFVNHSGLASHTRLSPRAMVEILANVGDEAEGVEGFRDLLKRYRSKTTHRNATVRAKTGTMYFARGLVGYISCRNGGEYAFAYLASDADGRARLDAVLDSNGDNVPGAARSWLGRAREIERSLIGRWTRERCG